jgi:ring-1,2-phenylacetyl-CoA epoxidase subunit PaaD
MCSALIPETSGEMRSIPVKLSNRETATEVKAEPDLEAVRRLINLVKDPEIPILTIGDLGILRDVQLSGEQVVVTITPTYSGCPAMHGIEQDIRSVTRGAGYQVEVKTALSPAWTTDWLTDVGRAKLKAYGIAPPLRGSADKHDLMAEERVVACPRCDSLDTRKLSEFGSTACKALHTCNDCLQPFDYFKCL